MTATTPAVPARRPPTRRLGLAVPGRLLRLELRRTVMPWILPAIVALFWLDGVPYDPARHGAAVALAQQTAEQIAA